MFDLCVCVCGLLCWSDLPVCLGGSRPWGLRPSLPLLGFVLPALRACPADPLLFAVCSSCSFAVPPGPPVGRGVSCLASAFWPAARALASSWPLVCFCCRASAPPAVFPCSRCRAFLRPLLFLLFLWSCWAVVLGGAPLPCGCLWCGCLVSSFGPFGFVVPLLLRCVGVVVAPLGVAACFRVSAPCKPPRFEKKRPRP